VLRIVTHEGLDDEGNSVVQLHSPASLLLQYGLPHFGFLCVEQVKTGGESYFGCAREDYIKRSGTDLMEGVEEPWQQV